MEFSQFVRKPFIVEATEVTAENIAEVAELIGTLREKDNGTPYIAVDRRLVPNLYRVFPGFWLTRMGDNIRCYSKRVFKQQFVGWDVEIQAWVDFMNTEHSQDIEATDENETESSDFASGLEDEVDASLDTGPLEDEEPLLIEE
jgi:hypothetical protein